MMSQERPRVLELHGRAPSLPEPLPLPFSLPLPLSLSFNLALSPFVARRRA